MDGVVTVEGVSALVEAAQAAPAAQASSQAPAAPQAQAAQAAPASPQAQAQASPQAQPQTPAQTQPQAAPQTQPQNLLDFASQQPQPDTQPSQAGAQGNAQAAQPGQTQAQQDQPGQAAPPDPASLPVTDFSKVDLGVDPASLDAGMVKSFGEQAVGIGLTPLQCKALAQWQVADTEARAKAHMAEQLEILKGAWGAEFDARCHKVLEFCARMDRAPGLAGFSAAVTKSGAGANAVLVQGLYAMAQAIGEDSAGRLAHAGRGTETALEGIQRVFAEARARRPGK